MFEKIQHYAKFIVALLGTVITAGATLIPENDLKWIAFVLALVTSFAVYQVPNKQTPAETPIIRP